MKKKILSSLFILSVPVSFYAMKKQKESVAVATRPETKRRQYSREQILELRNSPESKKIDTEALNTLQNLGIILTQKKKVNKQAVKELVRKASDDKGQ